MTGGEPGSEGPPPVRFGLVFPTTEIGESRRDVDEVARLCQAASLDFVSIYDHVVSADPAYHPGWSGPYTTRHTFHEPFTTLAYLAGRCDLELMTGVLVLPQRQAVLVAKQAAQLALLTGGRFLLGVGTGWNELEYRALGMSFVDRGRRLEEQLEVMRRLWAEPTVTFVGADHDVDGVGMAPPPPGGRVPLWLGSGTEGPGLRRVGRLADGWITMGRPDAAVGRGLAEIAEVAVSVGRDPADIALQGMVQLPREASVAELIDEAEKWRALGAARVSFSGLRAGRSTVEHLDFVETVGEVVAELRSRRCS